MNIVKLRRETDQRLHRIIAASDPAAIDSRYSSFQRWARTPDRCALVAAHLTEAIWTVARVLPHDACELADLQTDMPTPGRIALDVLLETLIFDDEEGFVPELVDAFSEYTLTGDLIDGLTVLTVGMAAHLGGWVWHR